MRMKLNKNILWIFVIAFVSLACIWSFSLWAGGCSSAVQESITTTTATSNGMTTTITLPTYTSEFIYVDTGTGISSYNLDLSTGKLTSAQTFYDPISGSLLLDPLSKFIFHVGRTLPAGPSDPAPIEFVTHSFKIDPSSGAFSTSEVIVIGSPIQGMAFDPLGKFAYITGSDRISIYQFNSGTGGFTFIGSKEPGAVLLKFVAIDPTGKYAYVSGDGETTGKVWVFNINSLTGDIDYIENIDTGFASKPEQILIDHRGNFLYEQEYNFNQIRVYRIDQTSGKLSLIQTQPIKNPYGDFSSDVFAGIAIDPADRLFYSEGIGFSTPGYINVFRIDPTTGTLSLSNTIADLSRHESFAVDPAGKFVCLTSSSGSSIGIPNYISVYSVDPTAGSLTLVDSLETGTVGNFSSTIVGIK